jgi:hypothetical protein
MSKEDSIGLAEFIEQVKRELLSTEPGVEGSIPLFSVDEVTLELQVAVHKEGKAGLQIYVVELGGGVGRDDTHNVTVTLTPLLSKEERIRLYKTHYPERWAALEYASVKAGLKGSGEESLDNLFGS